MYREKNGVPVVHTKFSVILMITRAKNICSNHHNSLMFVNKISGMLLILL